MATTQNQITQISPSQSDKVTTINEAFEQIDDIISATTDIAVSGDFLLTDEQQNNTVRFNLTDNTPGGAVTMALRARAKLFILTNGCGQTVTVEVDPGADGADGTTVAVDDGDTVLLYSDGTNVTSISSAGGGGASAFVDLTDTPASYSGQGGLVVGVNQAENALQFVSVTPGVVSVLSSFIVPDANQTIGTSQANVDLDTAVYDDAGVFDVGTPNRITIPAALNGGKVRLSASVRTTSFDPDDAFSVSLRKNGADFFPGAPFQAKEAGIGVASSNIVSAWIPVVTGDYFELQAASPQQSTTLNHDATWLQVEAVPPGGPDLAVEHGGTGASSAGGARTNLGLVIGTDVLAYNAFADSLDQALETTSNVDFGAVDAASGYFEDGARVRGLKSGVEVTTFTSGSGTFTPPADAIAVRVRIQGGGGGGAGAETTSGTLYAAAGGGGSGAYAEKVYTVSDLTGGAFTYSVGAGGAGGSAAAGSSAGSRTGGSGGSTVLSYGGSTITAGGGLGAVDRAESSGAQEFFGGLGGTVSGAGADVSVSGAPGGGMLVRSAVYTGVGRGAGSVLGQGGEWRNGNGLGANGFGAGGAGAGMIIGLILNREGGSGSSGVVIFEVYR